MSDEKSKSEPAASQPASSGPGAPQTGASAPAAAPPGQAATAAAAPPPKPAGPPPVKIPPLVPFVAQPDREKIDQSEHAADGSRPMYADREWIGYAQQGGGKVPDDWSWPHSPKQDQDEAM